MTMTADTTVGREKPIIFSGESVRAILAGRKSQTRRVVKPQPGMEENGDIHFKWATFYANGLTYTWDSNGVGGENWQANDHPKEDKFAEALKRGPANKFVPYCVGDRLWVRETWAPSVASPQIQIAYKADMQCVGCGHDGDGGYLQVHHGWINDPDTQRREGRFVGRGMYKPWKPPIHMPRWASRLTLEVTAVRAQKLQDISVYEVQDEGINLALRPGVDIDINGELWPPGERALIDAFQKAWDAINGKTYPWSSSPWVWVIEFQPVTP